MLDKWYLPTKKTYFYFYITYTYQVTNHQPNKYTAISNTK